MVVGGMKTLFLISVFISSSNGTLDQDASLRNLHEIHVIQNMFPSIVAEYEVTSLYREKNRCSWLHACICRDESSYTNGVYKLMVNCTQSGLTDIPFDIPDNTTVLALNGNSIQTIEPGAFKNLGILKYLDLSDNDIKTLKEGIFVGLENLHTLELSGNKIRYDKHSLSNSALLPVKKLYRLNLHQKLDNVTLNERYPTTALTELKHLKQLLVDGIEPDNISMAFSFMTNIKSLDLSSEYGRCNLRSIVGDMFKNLTGVTDLKMLNCSLEHVDKEGFSDMKSLTNLDLSYNKNLHFKNLANITYGLQENQMKDFKLVKIHDTFGDCTRLEAEHLVYFKNMKVENIYLDNNRLAYVSENAVQNIPRSMNKLSVTNNMLLAGEYIHKIFEKSVFENLAYLTMAEQSMNYDALAFFNNETRYMLTSKFRYLPFNPVNASIPEANTYKEYENLYHNYRKNISLKNNSLPFCGNCHLMGISYDIILYFPEELRAIDFSGLRIRNELKNICICEPNSLMRIDLERNVFWNWQGPIGGVTNLLNLKLSWNSCDNMSNDVFDQMVNLIELNLTRNFIERFLREDTEGRIFKHLKGLKYLLLADNKLRYLPTKLFQGLVSLKGIDLSYNFLTQIDVQFAVSSPLQYLDLSNNLLNKIGPNIMQKFDNVAKMNLSLDKYYLDLSNNKLSCACSDVDFISWVSRTKVQFIDFEDAVCTYKNGKSRRLRKAAQIYSDLIKDCADYTTLIIISCLGLVLFLIITLCGVIFRYRWDLRYLYYSIKLRINGNKILINQEDDEDYKFDAFVSYASENARFVKNDLVPELEDRRQFRLLVHDRDFRAGEFVNDNIMQAITSSRKTLILMSKGFLKSEWCIFEMNMARMESIKTGRNVVCLIKLEDVPVDGLPLEILDIIRQQTYIERPTNEDHMDMFWDRVQSALKN